MSSRGSQSKSKARGKSGAAKARTTQTPSKSARPTRSPLLSSVQRKMAVGQKDDTYEREADSIADRVVNEQPSPSISRIPSTGLPQTAQRAEAKEEDKKKEEGKKEDEKKDVQKAAAGAEEKEEGEPSEGEMAEGGEEEEETAQAKPIQREAKSEAKDEDQKKEAAQKADDKKPEEGKPEEDKKEEKDKKEENDKKDTAQKLAIQRKATEEQSESDAAEEAVRNKGAGEPLHPSVRRGIERSTGADMRDVRVHRDAAAERAAKNLNARAFTHGKDIWLGKGQSPRDSRLMAHEAAHVVQQTGRAQAGGVQREGTQGSFDPPTSTAAGTITFASGTNDPQSISIPTITLPGIANKAGPKIGTPIIAAPPGRTLSGQRDIWRRDVQVSDTALKAKLPENKGVLPDPAPPNAQRVFFLKTTNKESYVSGTVADIQGIAKLPNWGSDGKQGQPLEVDHIKEAQINGDNNTGNFQLLDRTVNSTVGNALRKEIKERIEAAAKQYVGPNRQWPDKAPSADSLREKCANKVEFQGKEAGTGGAEPSGIWQVDQVQNADPIGALKLLDPAKDKLPVGTPSLLKLTIADSAGAPRDIRMKDGVPQWNPGSLKLKGFKLTGLNYTPGQGGSLSGEVYKNNKVVEGGEITDLPITEIGGLPYTARVDGSALKSKVRSALRGVKGMSPIEIDDAYIGGDSVVTRGMIKPTVTIFKQDLTIDIAIDGDDVSVSKTFTAGDFKFPGPVKVTDSALTLSVGTAGLKVDGEVNFEVESVGKGQVSGKGSVANGFSVEGYFDFDKELFNDAEARITARYADDKFSGEGTIKIGEGKVKGIKSASAQVTVDGDKWEATGAVEPKVPGVESGTLGLKFDPEKGLEITGRLEFSKDIPRLKSGHIEAKVTKNDEGYQVEGSGSAELDIPGVTAGITAEYKNGIFKAEGTLGYKKDFASGEITAGVTNMGIGEDGQPTGDPGETVRPYGKGTVSLQFTPWLKGTAGIKLDPSGKMEVTGRVEVPNKIEVFPEKKLEKELLSVGVDIPIVGVSVAGQRVGIFLNISGSLTAKASIGPGTLENIGVDATFDPEDLSTAKITGTASFVVPAEAGLRLAISGAIGAGIPIVSAKAGLEIGGELGVKGEARADAKVEWTPQTGVNMEADLSIQAQPMFLLDITGFVDVSADLLLTTVELYHQDWQLASFEFGSGMTLGAKLKLKVENNEFKVPSFEDIEFIKPDIDLMEVAGNIIDQIA